MCGIAGIAIGAGADREQLLASIVPMTRQLRLRGPDGEGYWLKPSQGLAFGHRRLAIIDLSDAGLQPMSSASGRYTVTFNGEIYNFRELRLRLGENGRAPIWRGKSDTEVLLAALDAWGVEQTLIAVNGMFALALWDAEKSSIVLARDRFGEKPLYYGKQGKRFLFGSELKALAACPGWAATIDAAALSAYNRYNFVPGPLSIYQGIAKLSPGSFLSIHVSQDGIARIGEEQRYWSATASAAAARTLLFSHEQEASDAVQAGLSEAVKMRMESDVPLGAFLSGGIDSATIVAMMQKHGGGQTKTFTIANDDVRLDESAHAAAIARCLGTVHTEFRISPSDVMSCLPKIAEFYDEPFADSSQIPTHLIAREARQFVTVALTGDGGDELFGGYNRYFIGQTAWQHARKFPWWIRRMASMSIRSLSPLAWDRLLLLLRPVLGKRRVFGVSGDRIYKYADVLDARTADSLYEKLLSNGPVLPVGKMPSDPLTDRIRARTSWPDELSTAEAMMILDTMAVLPDDFLVKVDRASMGVSLETRAPFLDPALFALAWRVPNHMRRSGYTGKWLLRQVAYRLVPKDLLERPKQGFGVPLDQWLRGPLSNWSRERLETLRADHAVDVDADALIHCWQEHQSGRVNRTLILWNALMLVEWMAGRARAPSEHRLHDCPQHIRCE